MDYHFLSNVTITVRVSLFTLCLQRLFFYTKAHDMSCSLYLWLQWVGAAGVARRNSKGEGTPFAQPQGQTQPSSSNDNNTSSSYSPVCTPSPPRFSSPTTATTCIVIIPNVDWTVELHCHYLMGWKRHGMCWQNISTLTIPWVVLEHYRRNNSHSNKSVVAHECRPPMPQHPLEQPLMANGKHVGVRTLPQQNLQVNTSCQRWHWTNYWERERAIVEMMTSEGFGNATLKQDSCWMTYRKNHSCYWFLQTYCWCNNICHPSRRWGLLKNTPPTTISQGSSLAIWWGGNVPQQQFLELICLAFTLKSPIATMEMFPTFKNSPALCQPKSFGVS